MGAMGKPAATAMRVEGAEAAAGATTAEVTKPMPGIGD
jgi:hypothetical protein